MDSRLSELAARKDLLLARSRLHRLQMRHQALAFRRSIAQPATVLSVASSAPVRPLLFSALLFLAGRGRAARILRTALGALAIVKAFAAIAGKRNG